MNSLFVVRRTSCVIGKSLAFVVSSGQSVPLIEPDFSVRESRERRTTDDVRQFSKHILRHFFVPRCIPQGVAETRVDVHKGYTWTNRKR
jgi:hypothetical protein